MSLEHPVVPEGKKVLKDKNKNEACQRGIEAKEITTNSQSQNNLSHKINKIVLDYKSKYKIKFLPHKLEKEQNRPKPRRKMKKIRAEINKTENKKIQKITRRS